MKKRMCCLTVLVFAGLSAVCAGGSSASVSDEITEKHYSVPAGDISEIRIMVKDRAVEIIRSADSDIHITYYENAKEFYVVETDADGILTMKSASNKSFSDYFGFSTKGLNGITLAVPDPLTCSLTVSTTKNDVVLSNIEFQGTVSIDVNQGDVVLEKTAPKGGIILSAKNGSVSGIITGSYDDFVIQSEARKGKNNLPENKKGGSLSMTVNTNNGDIDISIENGR